MYTIILSVAFIIVKLISHRLHHMFDTSEVVEEEIEDVTSGDEQSKTNGVGKTHTPGWDLVIVRIMVD